jgi:hypothetical protein
MNPQATVTALAEAAVVPAPAPITVVDVHLMLKQINEQQKGLAEEIRLLIARTEKARGEYKAVAKLLEDARYRQQKLAEKGRRVSYAVSRTRAYRGADK